MKYTPYKVQRASNPLNIGITFFIGLLISILLGWLYNLNTFIPIIYLSVLVTVGLGMVIGILGVQILPKLFKIREKKVRLILVIFMLTIAYYSQWIAHVLYIVNEAFPSITAYLNYWIYPNGLFEFIGGINKYGTWSFGATGTTPVNGFILTLVWIAELLIIFFIGIQYVLNFPENPYSETQNKWFSKLILDKEFEAFYSKDVFMEKLNKNGIDIILNAKSGMATKFSQISIFHLERENHQYLSVDTIRISGKDSKKETTQVVTPIKITNDEAKQLMDKFDTKKAFFLDF